MAVKERKITVSVNKRGRVTILNIAGDLTEANSDTLLNELVRVMDEGAAKVLFNLGHLSSEEDGIHVLVTCYTMARERETELRLCQVPNKLRSQMATAALGSVFYVSETEDEGVREFA